MPAIIRAARLHRHRQPLRVESVELPEPGEDEVRVDLRYAGVNPIDRYVAEGTVADFAPLPRTLGSEASGLLDGRPVVVAGEGVGAIRDGVWGQAAVVPRAAVVELPEGVGLPEAAAMGVAGLTAWNVVHAWGRVTSQDRVLVLGASGGVGSMILSLARGLGATVWGQTGSAEKTAAIEEDGAQRAVVAGPQDLGQAVAELEPTIVFDPLGDGFVGPVVDALTPRGRLVVFGTSAGPQVEFNLQHLYRKGISLLGYGGVTLPRQERRAGLTEALEALRAGRLKVRIDSVLALDEVGQAFERLVERRVQGKLLLDVS